MNVKELTPMLSLPNRAKSAGKPGADYLSSEIAELLIQSAREIRHGMMAELAPLNLTFAEARIIRIIARAGDAPMRMRDLADSLGVVPRSVTTMVDALEEEGYITRQADPIDRRSIRVVLTERGREAYEHSTEARRASVEGMLLNLTKPEREELHSLLERLNGPEALAGGTKTLKEGDNGSA